MQLLDCAHYPVGWENMMIDTHSLNMPDTSQEYCSNHQVTGRTYGQLLQFWLVHKTEKMSPKIRGKAEQKAV